MFTEDQVIDGQLLNTFPQAARRLGMSVPWLRKAASENLIRTVKLGRSVRIAEDDLKDFVAKLKDE